MKALFTIPAAISAVVAAVPASAQTFTGPRIEGRVGWDGNSISIRDTRDIAGRGTFGSASYTSDFIFGGEVGFDAQLGSFVVGAYAGIEKTDAEEEFSVERVTFDTGRNITAGARAGFVINPNILAYAKAGYSRARLTPTFQAGANQTPYSDYSSNRDGFHFGGGAELALRDGFYTRADYTHSRYEDFEIDANTELRFSRNQITAAIGYRF